MLSFLSAALHREQCCQLLTTPSRFKVLCSIACQLSGRFRLQTLQILSALIRAMSERAISFDAQGGESDGGGGVTSGGRARRQDLQMQLYFAPILRCYCETVSKAIAAGKAQEGADCLALLACAIEWEAFHASFHRSIAPASRMPAGDITPEDDGNRTEEGEGDACPTSTITQPAVFRVVQLPDLTPCGSVGTISLLEDPIGPILGGEHVASIAVGASFGAFALRLTGAAGDLVSGFRVRAHMLETAADSSVCGPPLVDPASWRTSSGVLLRGEWSLLSNAGCWRQRGVVRARRAEVVGAEL
jgi:hypothetical protein